MISSFCRTLLCSNEFMGAWASSIAQFNDILMCDAQEIDLNLDLVTWFRQFMINFNNLHIEIFSREKFSRAKAL